MGYPFPAWLEHASQGLDAFGADDIAEMRDDAVIAAVHDQVAAGLDVITDGEQTRFDFNRSFYGYLEGIARKIRAAPALGPPGHDQRGKHAISGELHAPRASASSRSSSASSASPGRPTLKPACRAPIRSPAGSSRAAPSDRWRRRGARPVVRRELEAVVAAGCREICVDEPSMSCYAHQEDVRRFVDLFNRTLEPVVGRTRLSTHLCFGNFQGPGVAPRRYAPMFPAFPGRQGGRDPRGDGQPRVRRDRR